MATPALMNTYGTRAATLVKGEGAWLWDDKGKKYLDALSGIAVCGLGHSHPSVAKAVAEQASVLTHCSNFFDIPNQEELAENLCAVSGMAKVFFGNSGAEVNEAAIKMARYYHHRKGETGRDWILARERAYHGIAYGGGSLSGFDVYHDGFGPTMPHVQHLTTPWPYRQELYNGQDPTDFLINELEETIARIGADKIAAMVGEPIMGVGGMLVPPDDYWPRVEAVLRKHGILLIFDEVVTAYGRVGEWFAAQHFNVQPDIIITAKGITSGYIPLGAVLTTDAVAAELEKDFGFPMGFTYNGHPTAAAVALKNLEIIEEEGLLEKAKKMGQYLHEGLRTLLDLPIVGEVRFVGMMHAVELVTDKESRTPLPMLQPMLPDVIRREEGVIVRDCAHNLVLSPPLIMT